MLSLKITNMHEYAWTLCGAIQRLGCFVLLVSAAVNSSNRTWECWVKSHFWMQCRHLDVRQLSDEALANAERIFNELKHQKMLPFNQMDADPVRHELDRLLLSEVLGITEAERPDVHEGLALLRKMLCKEPSIHGGKKSKVNLNTE